MNPEELAVILRMFAVQGMLLQALIDLLEGKGVLAAEDVKAFNMARCYEEFADTPWFKRCVDLHNILSEGLGCNFKVVISQKP